MTPDQQALWDRFEGFLGKITERLEQVKGEAESGLGALFAQHPTDSMPIGNAMMGIDFRVKELRGKVQETWDAQIGPKFEAAGRQLRDRGLDRKQDYLEEFDRTWDTFKVQAMAAYYRAMYPLAQTSMQRAVPCNRCGGTLTLTVRHASSSVTCGHCQTVNQVMLEPAVSTYFMGAGHAFGEEAALPFRYAVERHKIAVDRDRRGRDWGPETLAQLEEWDRLELAYWTTYATAKAQVMGQPPDQELIQSRMDAFRKYTLETNQVWRRAKGG